MNDEQFNPTRKEMVAFIDMLIKARIYISDQHRMLVAIHSYLSQRCETCGDSGQIFESTVVPEDTPRSCPDCGPPDLGKWREGGVDLQVFENQITVSIERGGKFIPIISTYHGGVTSHAVWPNGINSALRNNQEGVK